MSTKAAAEHFGVSRRWVKELLRRYAHEGAGRKPPAQTYNASSKAVPQKQPQEEYRIRNDFVDAGGKLSLRYDGKLRHLGVGARYARIPVRMIIEDQDVIVINKKTGEILRYFKIDPTKGYQKAKPHPTSNPTNE